MSHVTQSLPTPQRALTYAAALVNRELVALRHEAVRADETDRTGDPGVNPQQAEAIFLSAIEIASMETRLRMMADALSEERP